MHCVNDETPLKLGMKVIDEITGKTATITHIIPAGKPREGFNIWGGIVLEFEDNSSPEKRYAWEVNPIENTSP